MLLAIIILLITPNRHFFPMLYSPNGKIITGTIGRISVQEW
jgi:hypothetical protein